VTSGTPRGRLYVSNFDSDSIASFDIAADARLTLLSVTAVPPGAGRPLAGAATPDGTSLFYAGFAGPGVAAFRVMPDGALVARGTFAPRASGSLTNAAGVAIDPAGPYLYASYFNGGGDGVVAGFHIDDDASLRPMGEPAPSGGGGSAGVAVSSQRRTLYVANKSSGTVSAFRIGNDGGPVPLGPPVAAGPGAFVLAVAPGGDRLYVANADAASLTIVSVDDDGSLMPGGVDVATGAASPRGLLISRDGRFLYAAHYNTGRNGSLPGSIATFRVGADGGLDVAGSLVSSGGNDAEALALAPDGDVLYVANFGSSTITAFAVGRDGALSPYGDPAVSGGQHPDFGSMVVIS
jgi:6-phosphogluconolactonase (cycloisomerase 2 family)